jgi:hypothetical protein
MVSKVALAVFLDDDLRGLRAYHAGNQADPRGISYFMREGLGDLVDI